MNQAKSRNDYVTAREHYIKSIDKGLLKVMSKMGISTLRSYHGAQIFEAIGISKEITEKYFTRHGFKDRRYRTLVKLPGKLLITHNDAYFPDTQDGGSHYHTGDLSLQHEWRTACLESGNHRLLQWATRTEDYEKFKEFSALVDQENRKPLFLRGCVNLKKGNPVPLDEVEPEEAIMKRFVTGAMSYGSISKEAHEALAIAMNAIGGRSNTGEGGRMPKGSSQEPMAAAREVQSSRWHRDGLELPPIT